MYIHAGTRSREVGQGTFFHTTISNPPYSAAHYIHPVSPGTHAREVAYKTPARCHGDSVGDGGGGIEGVIPWWLRIVFSGGITVVGL